MSKNIPWPELIGKVIVSTAVQASFGSLELPSRILMRTFMTKQEIADAFINEIHAYMFVGGLWTIGTTFLMYEMHEYLGAILNLILNILAMFWIIMRRYDVYVESIKTHNLIQRNIFAWF